ncbi:hypothetical protein DSO57_1010031 [Entomophthora muscae]|uniref:Uncharacterized protein n=1 Tax=Entomophthora muscae TaxID=34485 RepID=A0ACC2RXL5_9FUNG|nr:hypothetical protein DSO57_1010031 [Entomophthora muscae]
MSNNFISCLLGWYLVQIKPTSNDQSATHLGVLACKNLSKNNIRSDRHQALNPLAKSTTKIEDLVLTDALKKTEDGEMFLLHDNGQEVEDRIIALATKINLALLKTEILGYAIANFLHSLLSLRSFGSVVFGSWGQHPGGHSGKYL